MRLALRIVTQWLVVFMLAVAPPAPAATGAASSRVVAVGDIHGAYSELVSILQTAGLTDSKLGWSGGAATFIQTGDVMDRGAQTRACLDLLMKLQSQAAKAGGRVVTLLGNHEAMNLMGDLRYVTPEIYGTFAGAQSEKIRERAYQDYRRYVSNRSDRFPKLTEADDDAARQKWLEAHPLGYFEYRDALGPNGIYGRWLHKHQAIYQAAGGLFVHGGLDPKLNYRAISEIEDRVRAELDRFDVLWQRLADGRYIWKYMTLREAVATLAEQEKVIQAQDQPDAMDDLPHIQQLLGYRNWLVPSSNGPLWYRGLAEDPEDTLMEAVNAMLARLKAQFIVTGHTVISKSEITSRFEHRVFLIDTGMLKESYSGRASALEIQNGRFTALYVGAESKVLPGPGTGKLAPAREMAGQSGLRWR